MSACLWSSAWAQTGSAGAIGGTVQDASGAVMPGVTVVLLNPGTVGGNADTVTDGRGAYQFNRLVPATYGLRAMLPGFTTALRENVVVNADVTARVDFTLAVGDLSSEVTVTGEALLLDTTTTRKQTILDSEVIATLPGRSDVWVLANTVPAVSMGGVYNVGGSGSYSQSRGVIYGALREESEYTVDGMPTGGGNGTGSGITMYEDIAAFQEASFQTGNAPAESMRGGLSYNLVTKTGTNDFHGMFHFDGSDRRFHSNNLSAAVRNDLRSRIPAQALALNPNLQPETRIYDMFGSSANFSGPILRNRLWFAISGDMGALNQPAVGGYRADGTQATEDNRRKTWSYKASWQVAASHQVHFYERMAQKEVLHSFGGNLAEDRATVRQSPNVKYFEMVRWVGVLSPRLLAEVGASIARGPLVRYPQPEVQIGDTARLDSVTGIASVALPTYSDETQRRVAVQPTLTFETERHLVKSGYQYEGAYYSPGSYSFSHHPAGLLAIYRNGVPDSVRTYNTPTTSTQSLDMHSLFVQDTWAISRKLNLNAGVRVEKVLGSIPAQCQEQTVFVDARCFPEVKNVPNFLDVAPRFGLTFDVFGDGRTAVKFGANRYLLPMGPNYPARVNPIRLTNDTRTWTDRNGDLVPQLTELGPSSGFNFGTTNRYSEDIMRTYSAEFVGEVQHQLPNQLVVSVGYVHREVRRRVGSRNVAVPKDSYTPLQVTEANSGRQVTVYNQAPALRGRFDTLWDNASELDVRYDGLDLTFNKRLSDRWMMRGGMTIARSSGDTYDDSTGLGQPSSDLNNPNFTFRRGVLLTDVPFAFKMSGLYQLPLGIDLSGSAIHSRGLPERETVSVGRNTVTLTQVTQALRVSPNGATRLPSVNLIDLSLRREFTFAGGSIEPVMDVYNITNSSTITGRLTLLGPSYGRVTDILRGRMWKFGLNVNF